MVKRALQMLIKGFVISFLVVAVLAVIAVISYRLFVNDNESSDIEVIRYIDENLLRKIKEPKLEEVSKNLIFVVEENSNEVSKILLEVFHSNKNRLTYITIPVRTRYTMSEELYQKLTVFYPTLPQVARLSSILDLFNEELRYEEGVMLVEDLLDIKTSYYTVIPFGIYETMFTSGKGLEAQQEQVQVFTKEYEKLISKLKSKESIQEHIEEVYPLFKSNLSLEGRLKYLDSFSNTPRSNVFFELLEGEDQNSGYRIDELKIRQQVHGIINGTR